jgi:hypothetical protein
MMLNARTPNAGHLEAETEIEHTEYCGNVVVPSAILGLIIGPVKV